MAESSLPLSLVGLIQPAPLLQPEKGKPKSSGRVTQGGEWGLTVTETRLCEELLIEPTMLSVEPPPCKAKRESLLVFVWPRECQGPIVDLDWITGYCAESNIKIWTGHLFTFFKGSSLFCNFGKVKDNDTEKNVKPISKFASWIYANKISCKAWSSSALLAANRIPSTLFCSES